MQSNNYNMQSINNNKTDSHYNKDIFVKDYFDIHSHYTKIFGKSTLILMQVGSFHEAYNTDNDGPSV